MIDLRSDTVTQPTKEMRRAMAEAEVGNEYYGEDPTVHKLEDLSCEITGMEAAILVTSGRQGNLTSIMSHCERGDGVLIGKKQHLIYYEGQGSTLVSGINAILYDDKLGYPTDEELVKRTKNCRHAPMKLLCLENPHNLQGGMAIPPDVFAATCAKAHELGLKVHLDGARIFNAAVKWDVPVSEYCKHVDSIQICLTKSIAAPFGSMVCGDKDFIKKVWNWRRYINGSFRQIGFAAAAGIIAMRDMVERLAEDHQRAERLAQLLEDGGVEVEHSDWATNMVFVRETPNVDQARFTAFCKERGLLVSFIPPAQLRLVTHLNINDQDIEQSAKIIIGAFEQC